MWTDWSCTVTEAIGFVATTATDADLDFTYTYEDANGDKDEGR